MRYLYLHGFGSSGSTSKKAGWLRGEFARLGVALECPDLVPGDFGEVTLSGQIRVVEELLAGERCRIIGSSFGGLVAANYALKHPDSVDSMVLLAPAFGFPGRWLGRLGDGGLDEWRERGWLEVYHHAEDRMRRVHYGLYEDALLHPEEPSFLQAATIVHGVEDETVAVGHSRDFAGRHGNVELVEVGDGHSLESVGAHAAILDAVRAWL